MVELKEGDMISMSDAKKGEGSRGKWMVVPVKATKGKDVISVFVDNAEEAWDYRGTCKVSKIVSIKKTAHEYPKGSGQWTQDYTCTVILERPSEADMYSSGGFDVVEDTDLPFM